ncbi:MAG: polysaccharide biosynthesis/export family protein [Deltaproteobacteria bacterium]|nr:polysaccharide biosynthesis/export family protein [Deltaproteobacteria bacterium]
MRTFKNTKRLATVLLISMAWLGLAFPSFSRAAGPQAQEQAAYEYRIGPEDVLEISVWKNAELSKTVTVRPDGKISMPLIGDIQAAGLTPDELRDKIVYRLNEYQEAAIASVIVQSVNSYRIFILGEVKTPGTYLLKTNTTILQAISLAGGFTQYAAKNKIVLVRRNLTGGAGDERTVISFSDLVYGDDKTDKNLVLQPGDTIFVP